MWNPRADAWLAGFADGEATFTLALKRQQRAPKTDGSYEIVGVQPSFQIGLRADDVAVLERLAAVFGGSVRFYESRSAGRNGEPRYVWVVAAKADLRRLLDYFDRFSLHSKKAADFAIWRRATAIYIERGARDRELPALRAALMSGRGYAGPSAVVRHRLRPQTKRPTLRRR